MYGLTNVGTFPCSKEEQLHDPVYPVTCDFLWNLSTVLNSYLASYLFIPYLSAAFETNVLVANSVDFSLQLYHQCMGLDGSGLSQYCHAYCVQS